MDQEEQRAHDLRELSAQVARVKEKTRPWKETIALVLAIAAAAGVASTRRRSSSGVDSGVASYAVAVRPRRRLLRAGDRRGARHLGQGPGLLRAAGRIGARGGDPLHPAAGRHRRHPDHHAAAVPDARRPARGRHRRDQRAHRDRGPAVAVEHLRRDGPAAVPAVPGRRPHPAARGALGGQLQGVVTEIGITYIRLDTGDTVMSVPNSQVLAAAVGPIPRQPAEPAPAPPVPVRSRKIRPPVPQVPAPTPDRSRRATTLARVDPPRA